MRDEDETPTSPGVARLECPACGGDGGHLEIIENSIGYRSRRRRCMVCKGRGKVNRVVATRWDELLRDP